jgi:hypothetical protein
MGNRLNDLIVAYTTCRTDAALHALHRGFMAEPLHVPVSEPVKEPGRDDVPVICVRTETGAGAIPAFTSIEYLSKWKPGCLYTSLSGRSLLGMAIGM